MYPEDLNNALARLEAEVDPTVNYLPSSPAPSSSSSSPLHKKRTALFVAEEECALVTRAASGALIVGQRPRMPDEDPRPRVSLLWKHAYQHQPRMGQPGNVPLSLLPLSLL